MRTLLLVIGLLGCGATPEPAGHARGPQQEPTSETAPSMLIVDATGQPLPDARAVIVSSAYELLEGSAEQPLRADPQGRISSALTAEQHRDALLLVWAPGHASLRVPTNLAEEIRLPETSLLRGKLDRHEHPEHGRVQHVWLNASDSEAAWPFFVRCDVDDEGRFTVEGLTAGTYRVSSRVVGAAPVLHADTQGGVQFLTEWPQPTPALPYRLVDHEITADGHEHMLQVAFGRAMVTGVIVDEAGVPIAGAQVQFSSEGPEQLTARTNARGEFEAAVAPTPNLRVTASHPEYGLQWTELDWQGWVRYEDFPTQPLRLVLRRGVVLSGQLVDERGPRPNVPLLLIPAYRGSGPATLQARTDAQGRFEFERAALKHFEIVPRSLDEWHPVPHGQPGSHLRIVDEHADWLARATAGDPIQLRLESYALVTKTIRLEDSSGAVLSNRQVELWTRTAPDQTVAWIPSTDAEGRIHVLMERGVRLELWARVFGEGDRRAPWTSGIQPQWAGDPDDTPLALTTLTATD